MEDTICLIGFMGSGKTTIGRALAIQLSKAWVDLDLYIEEMLGKDIASLFAVKGEPYFREQEAFYLKEVMGKEVGVLSTGGGIIVTEANRALLKTKNTFYLKYDCDTLYKRIGNDPKRPLASSYEVIKARYEERQPLYEASARYIIEAEGKTVEEVTTMILERLKEE